jgi:elongation factor Ts
MIKELREKTGAGVLDCRQALRDCSGDFEAATEQLREEGLAAVAKRADREASEGLIETYTHIGSRVGVMLEMNCETDFVARTEDFQVLTHDMALHIAAASPRYMTREEIPEDVIEGQKEAYRAEALAEGKPEHIVDRIVEGRMEKFFQDICLMEQPFIRDDEITVEDLFNDALAKLGEKIVLRRFARYELGESLDE